VALLVLLVALVVMAVSQGKGEPDPPLLALAGYGGSGGDRGGQQEDGEDPRPVSQGCGTRLGLGGSGWEGKGRRGHHTGEATPPPSHQKHIPTLERLD